MLFDLRGRRRRAVQATYLTLAVLMGGGLVLFGIGGDVSGGLFDAFSGNGGGQSGDSQLDDRIDRAEKRLATSPRNEATLQELVRLYYQSGSAQIESGTTEVPEEARADFNAADRYYQRYVQAAEGPIDPTLAQYAFQMYSPQILNKPERAKSAYQRIAERQNTFEAYLQLVQLSTAAGDTRTADLAAQKAVDLAPQRLKKRVQKAAEQAKKPPSQQQ